ncbi:MAG: NADH-quinone oxidoreductase subunit L [Akkermansiaceae bacterium]
MNPWLLLLIPFASAAVIHLGLKRNAQASSLLSTISVAITAIIAFSLLGSTGADAFTWIQAGNFKLEIGYQLDKLATGMMIVVTGIGLLVHVFSLGYMKDDEAKARYFGCLSLFMFSMTGIVLASNFAMMFIFWELVGLSSYLLIGHWYQKDTAADAAKKAFLVNRIGDFGFMIGILMLWGITGTVVFSEMSGAEGLNSMVGTTVLGITALCIFAGAAGKSAQLPLHVWLPDAMEGPTPVSALIHAATMVAAGVYMMARFFFSITPEGMEVSDILPAFSYTIIAWIGGITSLVAALMATQQNDIKKILAYSTLSQLGYMVMAVGLLEPETGMFHLYTHAWFKALLFLGSACIIFACHHEQNIWKMGGLLKKMPLTAGTFAAGYAALIAVPYVTAGFYSKEEILTAAHGSPLFWVAAFVAFLTTFYMTRLFIVVFLGKSRSENADHAKEVGPIMFVPLIVLAALAIIAGFKPVAELLSAQDPRVEGREHPAIALIVSIASLVLGLAAGFILYKGKDKDPVSIPLFRDKFYLDEIYQKLVTIFQDAVAAVLHFFDEFIIGGLLVGGATRSAQGVGNIFRRFAQTGSLSSYAYLMGLGAVLVIYFTVFA